MNKIIGIDLGTSNSAAAVLEGGRPAIIPSAEGASVAGKAFPSYVAITKEGQKLVGEPARRQAVSNPEGTAFAFKRKMGTNFKFDLRGESFTPQQLSAFILQKIKIDAEAFLGNPVTKAVITVPAYFDDNQRQATKDAGEIAGLEVVRIINEPTAACLAYGLDKGEKEERILVFDFGGGTLDCTVMEFGNKVFEVKSTSGDTALGGTDMDNSLLDYLKKEFTKVNGSTIDNDKTAVQRLREAAEKAKIELSTILETEINLPYLFSDASGPKHFVYKLTRAKLEEIIRPILAKCKGPLLKAIEDSKFSTNQIDRIILVGGPTRMPSIRDFVENELGRKVERGVDPMECVAVGASIQAGVLSGEVKDLLLLDVTPLSLGIETMGGVFTKLIEKNTTIPTKKNQIFSTAADFQTSVDIHVFQGERVMAKDNVELGNFSLLGIPPAPRGIPQIEVTFDLDSNGILHVGAKDLGTGKEQKMQITSPHKLSKEKIDEMRKTAEDYAQEDKEKLEMATSRNEAESTVYTASKTLSELKDKIPSELQEEIKKAMAEVNEEMTKEDAPALKDSTEKLKKVLEEAGKKIYENASAASAQNSSDAENKESDKVVDVPFENKEQPKQ